MKILDRINPKEKDGLYVGWEKKKQNLVLFSPQEIRVSLGIPGGIILDLKDKDNCEIIITGMTPERCDLLIEKTKELKKELEEFNALSPEEKKKYWEDM